ncbi:MAG: SDR family oxidoreductase [Luteibaculaceae bacterium]
MQVKDSVFLVTGGTSGIGKALAVLLKEHGGKVFITGRDAQKLESVKKEIGVEGIVADVSNEADVLKTYETVLKTFGKLDALINNAGIGFVVPIEEYTLAQYQEIFGVNVFGAALMGREAAKLFKKQNYGNIVNIGSTASQRGYPGGGIYSASKFALRSMSQCWAAELRKHNVRVTHVNPSEVTTAFAQTDRVERPEVDNKLRGEEIAHAIVSALTMDNRGFVPEITIHATNPF